MLARGSDKDGAGVGQVVGDVVDLGVGDGDVFGIAAGVLVHAEQAPGGAEVLGAALAGSAVAAADEGVGDDAAAVGAAADEFMAEDQGSDAAAAMAEEAGDVGAAEAGDVDGDFGFAGAGTRAWALFDGDLKRRGVDQDSHGLLLLWQRSTGQPARSRMGVVDGAGPQRCG